MSQNEDEYDKQFKADLEKAIALSLETSEYEKFRNEQRRKYSDFVEPENSASKNVLEPIVLKPRPRPEPYASVPKANLGLPPPPQSLRKNSGACSTVDDLISFSSPSKDNGKNDDSISNGWKSSNVQHSLYPDLSLMFPSNLSSSENKSEVFSEFKKDCFVDKTSIVAKPISYGFKTEVTDIIPNFRTRSENSILPQYTPQNTGASTSSVLSINTNVFNNSFFGANIKSIGYNQPTLDVLKVVGKKQDNNLIDLAPDKISDIKKSNCGDISVLDAFDPLKSVGKEVAEVKDAKDNNHVENQETKVKELYTDEFDNEVDENEEDEMEEDNKSVCSGSFYDPFDPFDYMYSPSVDGSQGDPIYAAVNKAEKPPLVPARNYDVGSSRGFQERYVRQKSRLFENITILEKRAALSSGDLQAFYDMVKDLRQQYVYTDSYTNVGLVISPTIESNYTPGTSIKLIVYSSTSSQSVPFTCDLSSSVEHVIVQVVCSLEGDMAGSVTDYVLKVYGLSEYFTSETCLGDYEYVHQCIKLEKDVALTILPISELQRPLMRTAKDDANHADLTLEDLLPNEPVQPISYDTLVILLETIEREMEKLLMAAREISTNQNLNIMPPLQPRSVEQAIKAVCALMGHVETIEISEALAGFNRLCAQFIPNFQTNGTRTEITADDGDYSMVTLSTPKSRLEESLTIQCDKIREAVRSLIESYCHAFNVDFQLSIQDDPPPGEKSILELQYSVVCHIGGLHRLDSSWTHTEYVICVQIFHGTRAVKSPLFTEKIKPTKSFYNRVAFDTWLNLSDTTIAALPRESRLVFSLYGYTQLPPDHEKSKANPDEPQYESVELGWAAIQFFNHEGILTQGSFLLSIWPPIADKRFSPAPGPGTHPRPNHPVLRISLPDYGGRVVFPELSDSTVKAPMYEFGA